MKKKTLHLWKKNIIFMKKNKNIVIDKKKQFNQWRINLYLNIHASSYFTATFLKVGPSYALPKLFPVSAPQAETRQIQRTGKKCTGCRFSA